MTTPAEALAAIELADIAKRLLAMVDPNALSDVRGPDGQHEGEYIASRIDARITELADTLAAALARVERHNVFLMHRLGEHVPGCEWCVMAAEQAALAPEAGSS